MIAWLQYLSTRRKFPWIAGLLAALPASPSLTIGWYIDDYFHRLIFDPRPEAQQLIARYWPDYVPAQAPMRMFRFIDGIPDHNRRGIDLGLMSWWSSETSRVAFWRPLTALTHLFDYTLWPNTPALMHLHSLLWYALVVCLVTILYRKFLGADWIVALAALLFAVNEGHGITVGWLSNRNALIGAFFGLTAFRLHIESRDRNSLGMRVAAVILFLAALFSAEAGLGVFGYLLAYTFWLDSSSRRSKIMQLTPYLAAIILWRIVYNHLGFGAAESEIYIDPANNPLRFIAALPVRLAFAVQDIFFWPPANAFVFYSDRTAAVIAFVFLLIFIGFLWMIRPLWREDARLRFALTGSLFSAVPFCAALPDGRNLLIADFGGMMAVAMVLGRLPQLSSTVPMSSIHKRARTVLMLGLIGIHAVIAPFNFVQTPFLMKETARRIDSVLHLGDSQTIAGAEVVVANTPCAFFSAHIGIVNYFNGRPIPQRILTLAQGTTPVSITRLDSQTLAVRPRGGFLKPPGWEGRSETISLRNHLLFNFSDRFSLFFRDPYQSIPLGEEIVLTGVKIEITELNDAGRPAEAVFHFNGELSSPSRVWLKWNWERWGYEPLELPAVGETITL